MMALNRNFFLGTALLGFLVGCSSNTTDVGGVGDNIDSGGSAGSSSAGASGSAGAGGSAGASGSAGSGGSSATCSAEQAAVRDLITNNQACTTADDCTQRDYACATDTPGHCSGAKYLSASADFTAIDAAYAELQSCLSEPCTGCTANPPPPICDNGRCVAAQLGTTCVYDGEQYQEGDTFPATDGCNNCECGSGGEVSCTEEGCEAECSAFLGLSCGNGEYCDYAPDAVCGGTDASGVCREIPPECDVTSCTGVCGCDGKFYCEECFAHAAGTSVTTEDICNKGGKGEGVACGGDSECQGGLKCCYPCGVPGCQDQCTAVDGNGECPAFP